MTMANKFDFGDNSVATAYDNVLVPALFDPWARALLDEHRDWHGRRVLDVATGTGIVARLAAERVGPTGAVTGVDLNPEMLARAQKRCADAPVPVELLQSPADQLAATDESVDIVLCQQGFQFFPDRVAAARDVALGDARGHDEKQRSGVGDTRVGEHALEVRLHQGA